MLYVQPVLLRTLTLPLLCLRKYFMLQKCVPHIFMPTAAYSIYSRVLEWEADGRFH